jgi:FkbM family methyltransferase
VRVRNTKLRHELLRAYRCGPDHPFKLRIFDYLRSTNALRYPTTILDWGVMKLDIVDYVQSHIYLFGCYEPLSLRCFLRLLKVGDRVIDVGANVGQYSIAAATAVGTSGLVVAIEPNPVICSRLLLNRKLNGYENCIQVVAAAVSPKDDVLELGMPSEYAMGTTRLSVASDTERFSVGAMSINRIAMKLGIYRVKVMKVDIEGGDLDFLESMLDERILVPDNIIFEYIPQAFKYKHTSEEIINLFNRHDYELRTMEDRIFTSDHAIPEDNLWAAKRSN